MVIQNHQPRIYFNQLWHPCYYGINFNDDLIVSFTNCFLLLHRTYARMCEIIVHTIETRPICYSVQTLDVFQFLKYAFPHIHLLVIYSAIHQTGSSLVTCRCKNSNVQNRIEAVLYGGRPVAGLVNHAVNTAQLYRMNARWYPQVIHQLVITNNVPAHLSIWVL